MIHHLLILKTNGAVGDVLGYSKVTGDVRALTQHAHIA